MDPLLKKLNHRPQMPVTVLQAPAEVEPLLDDWTTETAVRRRLGKDERFVLAFVRTSADLAKRAPKLVGALVDDGVLWLAYPKQTSKRYRSDLSRNDSWAPLGDLGMEPVRSVAIGADWSAVRFRRAEHIAKLDRDPSRLLSTEGRRRSTRPPVDPPEVAAFLAALPDDRQETVARVHDVIRRAAPELKPALWDKMLGYGRYPYRYASGREGEFYVVGLASQKQYVSLYLCATVDGGYLAEANADRLGKVSVGKSCVRFKKLDDLDLEVVAELVRRAADSVPSESRA
ncbi:MAG: DUF1801 domain-containing protein [Acidimicrobiales bacterium]